jgi:coenzyme F420 hydrogenase subunit beta
MPPEKPHWAELFTEVVTSGLCTGCAACIVACPYDVLSYDDTGGRYKPFHIDAEGGPDSCTHGVKGCTMCTRACPRFRLWEPEVDTHLFGRERTTEEVAGVAMDTLLVRATDPEVHQAGQDGGLVSALLIWALEHDVIDAALVSDLEGDGSTWKAVPAVATTRAEVLAAAGSRLTIGLMCSKTFDDAIFPELFEAKYGIARADISKMNIKGVFQVWTRDGGYHEIPLKEAHAWTREGCTNCPDFAAEHADISTGGIGAFNDWTLTIVRTDKGRDLLDRMIADGALETRPGDDDPGAIALLHRLARVSRRRWPETAVPMPRRLPAAK